MCIHADGLYVGGDSLSEHFVNLREVFSRLRNCGMTIKPNKLVICPKSVTLFGWKLSNGGWSPLQHKISPLRDTPLPKTVKMLRSFLGSYKQLSCCIPEYAVILSPLEKIVGGKASAEIINWNAELSSTFQKAKESLNYLETVHIPKPTDQIITYSDFSQINSAIGGRMEIKRKFENGEVKVFHGGFSSVKVPPTKSRWISCEGESLATKLVLEHFSPQIRANNNTTLHFTDNLPVVYAANKAKTGSFSASSRVATFLSMISTLDVEILHKSGKSMFNSDFLSRNTPECTEPKCQICTYVADVTEMGDNIRSLSVEDIMSGKVNMPFLQRHAWKNVQNQDKTLSQLIGLINSSQLPEKKRTNGDNTVLKLLHTQYSKGKLKIESDGLLTVSQKVDGNELVKAIIVPTNMYPGLIQALHLKLNHPSKSQLQKVLSRYFYCVGHLRMPDTLYDNCHTCLSLKKLPQELFPQSTEQVPGFGARFAVDVMVRCQQKILVCREKLTQFVRCSLLPDETATSLGNALFLAICDLDPDTGAIVRVDNSPGFMKLKQESEQKHSPLSKLNISVELGRTLNPNKNAIAENCIQELHRELLRAGFSNTPVNAIELANVVRTMNSRIRNRSYSSKEMLFCRSQETNKKIPIDDQQLSTIQYENRISTHPPEHNDEPCPIEIGMNVFIKDKKDKNNARVMYKILDIDDNFATVARQDKKFLARQYQVPISKLISIPLKSERVLETEIQTPIFPTIPKRVAAEKALEKIASAVRLILSKPPNYAWDYNEFVPEAGSYFVTILDNLLSETDESNNPSPDESFQSAPDEDSSETTPDISDLELSVSPPPPPSQLRPQSLDHVQLEQAQQLDHLLPPAEDLPPPIPRRQSSRAITNPVTNYANYHKRGTK